MRAARALVSLFPRCWRSCSNSRTRVLIFAMASILVRRAAVVTLVHGDHRAAADAAAEKPAEQRSRRTATPALAAALAG
jgi:hypothetical protein